MADDAEKHTPLWHKAGVEVNTCKTPHVRASFDVLISLYVAGARGWVPSQFQLQLPLHHMTQNYTHTTLNYITTTLQLPITAITATTALR